ncbi:MAG: sensor histidine kinase [Candidatus Dormibacteraeota bacterium]|nr:sensor histidine kinase [Candidatus Dormibacteraeota bacterium]
MISQPASLVRRWRRPVAIAAVVELITLGTLTGAHRLLERPIDALAVILLAAAGLGIAFVERWPLPALAGSLACTAAYVALGYQLDSPWFLGLAVTGYLAGTAGARLRAVAFAVASLALLVAAALGRPPDQRTAAVEIAVVVAIAIAAGQVAAELRAGGERRAQEAREEDARRRLADERLRIARELHDVVSHSIAMINVRAGVAVHVMEEQPAQAREALLEIKAASRDALHDLRGILGLLRTADEPEPTAPAGGLAQLPDLVSSIRAAGVQVSVEQSGETPPPASVDLAAYRVLQEALTNVVRHAPGAAVRVAVRRQSSELLVDVEDDGGTPGHDRHQGAGQGLLGMQERVQATGGSLEVGPRPQGGFAVRARMPLPEAERE